MAGVAAMVAMTSVALMATMIFMTLMIGVLAARSVIVVARVPRPAGRGVVGPILFRVRAVIVRRSHDSSSFLCAACDCASIPYP